MNINTAIVLTSIFFSVSASASASVDTYFCDYPTYSDERGNYKTKGSFSMSFIVDKVSKKNYMLGKRSVEVAMFRSPGQIAFIERTVSGSVMTTSITDDLSSVHSRNSVVYGQIVPSQYYGKCVIR